MAKQAALLDAANIVRNIIVVADDVVPNVKIYCEKRFKGTWEESFTDGTRQRPASIGGSYDPVKDVFINQQPFSSWTLDENNDWQPPVPMPEGDYDTYKRRTWDEANQRWIAFNQNTSVEYYWDPATSSWTQL